MSHPILRLRDWWWGSVREVSSWVALLSVAIEHWAHLRWGRAHNALYPPPQPKVRKAVIVGRVPPAKLAIPDDDDA